MDEVFGGALPLIHSTLASYYRLDEREVREAEQDLYAWFHRFVRRSGSGQASLRVLRLSLLVAACQYGRSFQMWKQEGTAPDENLAEALAREPRELACELVARLEGGN